MWSYYENFEVRENQETELIIDLWKFDDFIGFEIAFQVIFFEVEFCLQY